MKIIYILLLSLYSTVAFSAEVDCDNAMTTMQMNKCAKIELEKAKIEMNRYLDKSKEQINSEPELLKSIDVAQKAWETYSQAHCESIYERWKGGSIRNVMYLSCKTNITKQRTHEIWANFLTFMDRTPPILKEPEVVK